MYNKRLTNKMESAVIFKNIVLLQIIICLREEKNNGFHAKKMNLRRVKTSVALSVKKK